MNAARHGTTRVVCALLLGAMTTVAVSWLAMFLPRGNAWNGPAVTQDVGLTRAQDAGAIWTIARGSNAWHEAVVYWHMQISGVSLMFDSEDFEARKVDVSLLPRHLRPRSVDDLTTLATFHATGWPMRALACSVRWKQQIANEDVLYTVRGGLQLPPDAAFNPRALPLSPVLPGFLVNTLCDATIWLGVVFGFGTWRAHRRVKRNRCARCGYPRAGLEPASPCPECGRAPKVVCTRSSYIGA